MQSSEKVLQLGYKLSKPENVNHKKKYNKRTRHIISILVLVDGVLYSINTICLLSTCFTQNTV